MMCEVLILAIEPHLERLKASLDQGPAARKMAAAPIFTLIDRAIAENKASQQDELQIARNNITYVVEKAPSDRFAQDMIDACLDRIEFAYKSKGESHADQDR